MSELWKSIVILVLLAAFYLSTEHEAKNKIKFVRDSLMIVIRSNQNSEVGNNLTVLNLLQKQNVDEAISYLEAVTKIRIEGAEHLSSYNIQAADKYQKEFCQTACISQKEESNAL